MPSIISKYIANMSLLMHPDPNWSQIVLTVSGGILRNEHLLVSPCKSGSIEALKLCLQEIHDLGRWAVVSKGLLSRDFPDTDVCYSVGIWSWRTCAKKYPFG